MGRTLSLALLLTACGTPATTDTGDTDDTETVDTDTDYDPCADPGTAPAGRTVQLSGTVTTESGAGIGADMIGVRFCNGATCINSQVFDCDGNYELYGLPEGDEGTLEVLPIDKTGDLATVLVPLPMDDTVSRELDVVMPNYDVQEDLATGAAEYELVPGFFVTASLDSFEKPSPFDPDPTKIKGVDVSSDNTPPIEGISTQGTIRAVYSLGPFDYEADPAVPFRITNSWDFADGEAELWVGKYAEGWVKVGDLVDDGNGDLTVAAGLPVMTLTVIMEKPAGL